MMMMMMMMMMFSCRLLQESQSTDVTPGGGAANTNMNVTSCTLSEDVSGSLDSSSTVVTSMPTAAVSHRTIEQQTNQLMAGNIFSNNRHVTYYLLTC